MLKWKKQFVEKYLPMWCRAELMDENRQLEKKVERLTRQIEEQSAYIEGMHHALRYQTKITVNGRSDGA